MAFLSSHTLYEARARTHQHHDSFLQYTVASSSHSRTVSVVGERICTRNSVLCVATVALVWVLRVFIHTKNKTFVIAYRPAKASSSHNNLTATEWTAHTISFLRARDHNAHHIALLRFYLFSTTLRRCGRRTHTHTPPQTHIQSRQSVFVQIFFRFRPSIVMCGYCSKNAWIWHWHKTPNEKRRRKAEQFSCVRMVVLSARCGDRKRRVSWRRITALSINRAPHVQRNAHTSLTRLLSLLPDAVVCRGIQPNTEEFRDLFRAIVFYRIIITRLIETTTTTTTTTATTTQSKENDRFSSLTDLMCGSQTEAVAH